MKTYTAILFLTIAAMFSSQCDSPIEPNQQFNLGDTLLIDYKESFHNTENNITVTLDSLLSDGRCPVDVMCFWAGNAEVKIGLKINETSYHLFLNTFRGYRRDSLISGYRTELLDLYPYPHSDSSYKKEDYQIKIVIDSQEKL